MKRLILIIILAFIGVAVIVMSGSSQEKIEVDKKTIVIFSNEIRCWETGAWKNTGPIKNKRAFTWEILIQNGSMFDVGIYFEASLCNNVYSAFLSPYKHNIIEYCKEFIGGYIVIERGQIEGYEKTLNLLWTPELEQIDRANSNQLIYWVEDFKIIEIEVID